MAYASERAAPQTAPAGEAGHPAHGAARERAPSRARASPGPTDTGRHDVWKFSALRTGLNFFAAGRLGQLKPHVDLGRSRDTPHRNRHRDGRDPGSTLPSPRAYIWRLP